MPQKMRLDPKNDIISQLLFGKQDKKDILIDLLSAVHNGEGKDRITVNGYLKIRIFVH